MKDEFNEHIQVGYTKVNTNTLDVVHMPDGSITKTDITTYREVNAATFVKLFSSAMSQILGLNTTGRRVFDMLWWVVDKKCNKDKKEIYFDKLTLADYNKFLSNLKLNNMSYDVFNSGRNILIKSNLIKKGKREGLYILNTKIIFNGKETFTASHALKKI